MWTPKRILILTFGFGFFVIAYFVYARYLGGINGLPPLPRKYWPTAGQTPPPPPPPINELIKKFELAFGKGCPESKEGFPIKIEVRAQGLLMAWRDFKFLEDGRVKLWPISVAVFGKKKGESPLPEINTIRAAEAIVTFEHPVREPRDIGKHKIIAGNIKREIRIRNNRGTAAKDDDLLVEIPTGPLFYDSKQRLIHTTNLVHLKDFQSKPKPHLVSGSGMRIDLLAAEDDAKKPSTKPKDSGIHNVGGVEKVTLFSSVDMTLHVNAGSGFLSSGRKSDTKAAKKEAEVKEKAVVHVQTDGPFQYDVINDFATFDAPRQNDLRRAAQFPKNVRVTRTTKGKPGRNGRPIELSDRLQCDHLKLQFLRKEDKPDKIAAKRGDGAAQQEVNLQIETAHATGRTVKLTSEKDALDAYGNDFFYDAAKGLTVLKGPQMKVEKEGHVLYARELHIEDREIGPRSVAWGPGRLMLHDSKKPRPDNQDKVLLTAKWSNRLVTDKVRVDASRLGGPEGKEILVDVLHFVGDADLNDEASQQRMKGDELTIWLDAEPDDNDAVAVPKKKDAGSRQPRRIIAVGNVTAQSPDFVVERAQKLDVRFVEPANAAVASAAADPPAKSLLGGPTLEPESGPGRGTKPLPKPAEARGPRLDRNGAANEKKSKSPIFLTARTIEADVLRLAKETQLHSLNCEGSVRVRQAPEKKDDKGVLITGDKLRLEHTPLGDKLVVSSDVSGDNLARLTLNEITIFGPEVNVDQIANKVWVNGDGAMTMDSDTDFQGNKLEKPQPLNVFWVKYMLFNGTLADFEGSIQAHQGTAFVSCEQMIVYFDRPISLKPEDRAKTGAAARDGKEDKARVRNLLCSKAVRVEEKKTDGTVLQKLHQLRGSVVSYENEVRIVRATGPGDVLIVQRGSSTEIGPGRAAARNGPPKLPGAAAVRRKPDDNVMKLTYVVYGGKMYANDNSHVVKFDTNVRVRHFPLSASEEKRIERIKPEQIFARELGEGALDLRCDRLDIRQLPQKDGKAMQEMRAQGRVKVRAKDFWGEAAKLNYNEEKDQVIFDGDGGLAELNKSARPGARPQKIIGRKIIYVRKTGEYYGEGIREASQ